MIAGNVRFAMRIAGWDHFPTLGLGMFLPAIGNAILRLRTYRNLGLGIMLRAAIDASNPSVRRDVDFER